VNKEHKNDYEQRHKAAVVAAAKDGDDATIAFDASTIARSKASAVFSIAVDRDETSFVVKG